MFGQTSCLSCPAGYYCPTSSMTAYSLQCPSGYYCPLATSSPYRYLIATFVIRMSLMLMQIPFTVTDYIIIYRCPAGYFSPNVGNQQQSDCSPCTPGYYCASPGLSAVSGTCNAGYYCTSLATSAYQFTLTSTGGPCPAGSYCPAGASIPMACHAGTYMGSSLATGNVVYNGTSYQCNLCTGGKVCSATGLTAPSGQCPAGYWCLLGAPADTPVCSSGVCASMYGLCPIGYYCPAGSSLPIPCASGTYMGTTGSSQCTTCPPGFYCDSSVSLSVPTICPQGYYCPSGTSYKWSYPCPLGTYGDRAGLQNAVECTGCTGGSYCSSSGLSAPSSVCPAGYYCPVGSANSTSKIICPIGSYCPQGSVSASPCPPGTYNPSTGKRAVQECLDCSPGSYCGNYNLTAPTGPCSAGFFCYEGSNVSSPRSLYISSYTGRQSGGGVCTVGHYCPQGTSDVRALINMYYIILVFAY